MANASHTRFESFTIDAVSRTPITAQVACHAVVIRNADLVNDCTIYHADSGGSGVTLSAGAERRFEVPSRVGSYFQAAEVVVWAQADAGTGPIHAECVL